MNRADHTTPRAPILTLLALAALALGLLLGAAGPAAAETFEEVDGGEAGAVTEAEARELADRDPVADAEVAPARQASKANCDAWRKEGWANHESLLKAFQHKSWDEVRLFYEWSVEYFRAFHKGNCHVYGSPYAGSGYL